MYKIVCKKELNSAVTYMEIEAPFVARKAKAGQFIIFRVDEKSERVPLTIAGYDREKGTVAIIFQKVGLSTEMLGSLNEGDYIQDFVGPLGKPTDVEGKKRVCVVGGGVGCAIAYPSAKAFKEAGVETDVIVGRTVTIDELMNEEGYEAVFIGSGAGLPRFMGIPGENLNGVVSANEFLTRTNLMKAYDTHYDTPIYVGQRVVVVGGGNVAMDAVRTAKRLGAEATIVYRRSEKELPARVEEVHHAKEEGIEFRMLTNPTSIIGDEKGWVVGISCVEMELGEPDESGRRSPIEKAGSDFEIPCDVVIMALGTSPNPLLKMTTEGLETNRKGCLVADEKGATTREGIFAGGDAVTGAATVILAMGAGRKAAKSIDEYIRQKKH